jgi:hypothetical protein
METFAKRCYSDVFKTIGLVVTKDFFSVQNAQPLIAANKNITALIFRNRVYIVTQKSVFWIVV